MAHIRYKSDVRDAEWQIIEPLVAQKPGRGRKREVNIREVVNGIFYIVKTGCQWEYLPKDFPDYRHVNYYYRKWIEDGRWDVVLQQVREDVRECAGKQPTPSAGILDSQSVKTAHRAEETGYDGNKKVKGRKRHTLVDTLGLLLLVWVTSAAFADRDAGAQLLDEAHEQFPRIEKVWADSSYSGELVDYAKTSANISLDIVRPKPDQIGFEVQPKRWIVERSYGWMNLYRRLSKDYEYRSKSSETMIKVAAIRIMLRRL